MLNFSATCKSKVLLPIPGSPPSRTSVPGTIPPPSTRSNSVTPEETRASSCDSISLYAMALASRKRNPPLAEPFLVVTTRSSTSEFHSPHSGHFPSHLRDSKPQDWRRKIVFGPLVIGWSLERVFLISRFIRQLLFFQKSPRHRIDLRRQVVIPVIVTRHFNQLRIETITVEHVARVPDSRQREKPIDSPYRNMNWDLAFRSRDNRTVLRGEGARVNRRRRKIFRFVERHVEREGRARRMAEQVYASSVNWVFGQ